jgi:hypothetical protein
LYANFFHRLREQDLKASTYESIEGFCRKQIPLSINNYLLRVPANDSAIDTHSYPSIAIKVGHNVGNSILHKDRRPWICLGATLRAAAYRHSPCKVKAAQ